VLCSWCAPFFFFFLGCHQRDIADSDLQLAFSEKCTGANNTGRCGICVFYDENKVSTPLAGHPLVLFFKLVFGDVAHGCKHTQTVEKSRVVVGNSQRTQLVPVGQRRLHLRGEQVGRDEVLFFCHCCLLLAAAQFLLGVVVNWHKSIDELMRVCMTRFAKVRGQLQMQKEGNSIENCSNIVYEGLQCLNSS